ncbi:hypothetical protein H0I76_13880 [Limibaculum sp. M0105]|uniref:Uncharacterized protein n=1 Tax=Thermohalobaculum xanthum TaxID=2753746 RepID=A0A8J7MA56_9RHOB|nr:hypothetical protein [Thermohalobaculum xanthum]MBK0400284.1 hypothetical protein [Thermohalobaculum xanthum]
MTAPGQPPGPELRALVAAAADRPLHGAAAAMAAHLATRPGVLAVLFYGNMLRDTAAGGLLDFYCLTERDADWSGPGLAALGCRLLPPNVYHVELPGQDGPVHAKVAVMRLAAFGARMRAESWDTTLWARFSQPVVLAYARDAAAREAVLDALAAAAGAAAWWARHFAEDGAGWRACWAGLYARTYGAELRVESAARADAILDAHPEFFEGAYAALIAGAPLPKAAARRRAEGMWARRRRVGKLINAVRLTKAAATFRGGLAYALSKVERHSGRPVELSGWQRRWPILAAPFVFARLLWQRRLR